MRIQCDVCNKDEAAVFCPADEAALCDACDHSVHHANKLAQKHRRFSLIPPSHKQCPLCDICQEKRAFLFCQQDRAILCKDCDISIHKANEHSKNHSRFLLTGVKLSVKSDIYSVDNINCDTVPDFDKSHNWVTKPRPAKTPVTDPKGIKSTNPQMITNEVCNGSTSSISEYLEMLPGWHVEDFLDASSAPYGFSKTGENDLLPFWDDDVEKNLKPFSSENIGIWVPQAPPPLHQHQVNPSSNMAFSGQICFRDPKELATTNIKYSKRLIDDGGFTVPQISPSISSKSSRTVWL
ncbi:B-box zinc finger protein 21 [Heracleum sosnowskyi]|uniref:B-box zinc finger protein 21 n=1 Tax=Heracleum sosnowskyi TaxID=360622 RepID=A0AAD8N2F7_9APIA|nr:B-box zinc finger protein 21 [Heracleum sosnowskyi]